MEAHAVFKNITIPGLSFNPLISGMGNGSVANWPDPDHHVIEFQSAYQRHGEWKPRTMALARPRMESFNPLISGMGNGSSVAFSEYPGLWNQKFQSAYQRHGEWKLLGDDV